MALVAKTVNWKFVLSCLRYRRFNRKMEKLGYRQHETDWEIVRGGRQNEIIIDVKIGVDGKSVWTKLGRSIGK